MKPVRYVCVFHWIITCLRGFLRPRADSENITLSSCPSASSRCLLDRLWATRRNLWVDRIASAWLIRRFIDREARFLWLASPADCPADAVGFDFDGAEFTHVETATGASVTFETLLAAFGLDRDAALARIGAIVHQLDVGGLPVAEAAGLERLLQGIRARTPDDDALLADASRLLDDLHLAFQKDTATS